jgi:putative rhamnosyltransferase
MRHYVMTRSAYGPEWKLDANARRLAVTRGITGAMMRLQTTDDWTWIVLVDERDPLIEERIKIFEVAAPRLEVIRWHRPAALAAAPWDKRSARSHKMEQIAATAYTVDWRGRMGLADDTVLMTRLDDDDALMIDTLARVKAAAVGRTERTILMHPMGYRVFRGRYSLVRHESNAMHTLLTPPGDTATVYDYGHTVARRYAPVVVVDEDPAWLWCRHRDTISGWKQAQQPITTALREAFPVDWSALR